MTGSVVSRFRISVFASACLIGGLAAWMLVPELIYPAAVGFPTDPQSAASIYAHRGAATTAAKIGLVRGDLWTRAAFAYADRLWNVDPHTSSTDELLLEQTRTLTVRALSHAPHDSRLWLLLAATYLRFGQPGDVASAALRMSYYTGSNAIELVPGRLPQALQIQATQDEDFRELVRHDIQIAVIHKAELMPTIVAAYRDAPLSGRQLVEKTLAELDPSLLASIRLQGQSR